MRESMFRKTILGIAMIFLFSACSILDGDSPFTEIQGKWDWVRSTGGVTGQTVTPDSAGYSHQQLLFTWDEEFVFYQDDTVNTQGIYSLERMEDKVYLSYNPTSGSTWPEQTVEFVEGDTLVLMDQCTDCYTHTYVRVAE
jgi:hypothetical protein